MDNKMFCFQCQETARNYGCTKAGVCGKQSETSNLMDLLIYVTKGLSQVATRLRGEGKAVGLSVNHIVTYNLFQTITNANFDDEQIIERILLTIKAKEDLLNELSNTDGLAEAARYADTTVASWEEFSRTVGVLSEPDEAADVQIGRASCRERV